MPRWEPNMHIYTLLAALPYWSGNGCVYEGVVDGFEEQTYTPPLEVHRQIDVAVEVSMALLRITPSDIPAIHNCNCHWLQDFNAPYQQGTQSHSAKGKQQTVTEIAGRRRRWARTINPVRIRPIRKHAHQRGWDCTSRQRRHIIPYINK